MGKGGKKKGKEPKDPKEPKPPKKAKGPKVPLHLVAYADAAPLTGAKKIKKKCCRSTPRCKGCPVLLMRAARLTEAGVTGKDLKKALKKARAA
ncbi:hypothetical protein EV188_104172 [Actinomycetospora succinea]|uniref:Uncharacterized protein n=1 Tax=Actinomycetospora succinea TaxID=663603 RepID=A0A4V3D9R9_9PSEU|nr:hypothetical protein [Actinomycetospora succinea]TDQ58432.1 hypothetical protein EV188_104172 [Actinomycetospora succinea]